MKLVLTNAFLTQHLTTGDLPLMKTTKQFKILVGAAVTLASTLATAATPALADNYKAFPGSMCHGMDSASESKLSRGYLSIKNNDSSQYAYVMCPIVRGVPGDDEGTTSGPSSLVYVDKGNSQSMLCGLIGDWPAGGGFSYKDGTTTAQGVTYISIPKVEKRNIYAIFCSIPPKSSITGYYSFFK
jgi:hypothetical protein